MLILNEEIDRYESLFIFENYIYRKTSKKKLVSLACYNCDFIFIRSPNNCFHLGMDRVLEIAFE